jgi:hypothetical protein
MQLSILSLCVFTPLLLGVAWCREINMPGQHKYFKWMHVLAPIHQAHASDR